MGISKGLNNFDTASPDDLDNLGAYIRSSDGTLIDHATINSVERLAVDATLKDGAGNVLTSTGGALDVNLASGTVTITAENDGVWHTSNNPDPDNVGIISHTRSASPSDTEQVERTTAGPLADAIVNADVNAIDTASFNMGWNGTTWDRIKSSGGQLRTCDFPDVATKVSAEAAVNTTEVELAATPLSGRKHITIQNLSGKKIYLGPTGVTTSTGIELKNGDSYSEDFGENNNIFAIAGSAGGSDVRVFEAS